MNLLGRLLWSSIFFFCWAEIETRQGSDGQPTNRDNNSNRRSDRQRRRNAHQENNRKSPTYRVILITANGLMPFTEYYSGGRSGHEKKVQKIYNFLNNPTQKTLAIKQDLRWLIYPMGGIFILAGLAILFGVPVKQRWENCKSDRLSKSDRP